MAEIILTPLLQVIFEKLSSPLIEKIADVWELEDRCKNLLRVLTMVQAILEDADGRQATDKAVRIWLSDLKDAAYKAEDLLEELTYQSLHSSSYSNMIKSRSILDALQKVAIEGLKLNLKERTVLDRRFDKRETSSFFIGSEVYGREEDKKRMIEKLWSSSSSSAALVGGYVPVIPIVGIPGIGKTTVAQSIYNDDEVKKQFDLRIWVFVSDEFSVKKIIKAALESATGEKCELSDLDVLQSKLWNALCKKRYMLVLDDVWNEDENEWDKLRPLFGAGLHGSKILVTTSSHKVALMVDTENLAYKLKGLPESACWDLFKTRACLREEEDNYHNLMVIGKEIVKKCEGVPLAVKTLGSLMRFKREEREWSCVQDSDIWNLNEYRDRILCGLLVSYQHLPLHLRHCFAFCSIFPRNYEIKKDKIIHMWMAHGFILADGEKKVEDIGEEYFNELLWLSFFEDVKDCDPGCDSAYKMNDLFHHLAQSAVRNESVTIRNGRLHSYCTQIYHASCVSTYRGSELPRPFLQAEHLRTLLMFSEGGMQEVPSNIFSSFIYLRVLQLSSCVEELPMSIEKLRLLRYLDLSNSHFQKLPTAISSLQFLVTLNLFCCYNLQSLPAMCQLTGLRHLNISGCEALIAMTHDITDLVHLQTLPIFILSPNPKRQRIPTRIPSHRFHLSCKLPISIEALQSMDLRGELKIKHLEHVSSAEEAKAANLMNKKHIRSLGLCWGHDGADLIMNPARGSGMVRLQERKHQIPGPSQEPESGVALFDTDLATEVLQCLQPHCNLKNLYVVGYPGFKFPQWALPNLTMVVLIKCRGCIKLPTLGQLPSLRTLRMEEISSVEYIGQEFYGEDVAASFPSLQELFMQDFPLLEEWSSLGRKDLFPNLRKLTLRKCPNLISVPFFMSVNHLQLQSCNARILKCMEKLTSLSSLVIQGFDDLLYLPGELFKNNYILKHLKISSCPKLHSLAPELECLTSLKSLIIQWCGELHLLPDGFQNLTALESLEISDCHSLVTLPDKVNGGLKSLRTLSVENCSHLTSLSLGLQYLTALEDLTIMYCPSLTSLPDTMKHLSALKSLTIISCPQIEALPEGIKDVITLQCLEIHSCPRFAVLPDWFGNFSSLKSLAISVCPNLKCLPIAFKHLTQLQHLSIQDCPDLQERCQPDTGADWWKIAHVPYRYIFASQLQRSTGVPSSSKRRKNHFL